MRVVVVTAIDETSKYAFSSHDINKHCIHADPLKRQKHGLPTPHINLEWKELVSSYQK
jgi:hypothetical protein